MSVIMVKDNGVEIGCYWREDGAWVAMMKGSVLRIPAATGAVAEALVRRFHAEHTALPSPEGAVK